MLPNLNLFIMVAWHAFPVLSMTTAFASCTPAGVPFADIRALGSSAFDFTRVSSLPAGWSAIANPVSHGPDGISLAVGKRGDDPTIETTGYFFFGHAEVVFKAAPGHGIVTSMTLQSPDLDTIVWEIVGSQGDQAQTNYIGKGCTEDYDRGAIFPVLSGDATNAFHTYAIHWTSLNITWLLDGVVVRTLDYAQAAGGSQFPQTPMRLQLSAWAAGDPSNAPNVIEWSNGPIDYTEGPFVANIKSVKIVNYTPAYSYSSGNPPGDWMAVKVNQISTLSTSVVPQTSSLSKTSVSSSRIVSKTSTASIPAVITGGIGLPPPPSNE